MRIPEDDDDWCARSDTLMFRSSVQITVSLLLVSYIISYACLFANNKIHTLLTTSRSINCRGDKRNCWRFRTQCVARKDDVMLSACFFRAPHISLNTMGEKIKASSTAGLLLAKQLKGMHRLISIWKQFFFLSVFFLRLRACEKSRWRIFCWSRQR